MVVSLFLYVLVVLALLIAELRDDRRAQFFFKPLAALGFVLLALQSGALETIYGQIIIGGLVACAIGDLCLLFRNSQKLFMGGMLAFAMGHLAYLTASATHSAGPNIELFVVSAAFGILVAIGIYRWIKPNLDKFMKIAVALYTAIILVMVLFAINIDMLGWRVLVPLAAMMFAISDAFVARDRFVKLGPKNALAITPLYFGAQALFALSVSI